MRNEAPKYVQVRVRREEKRRWVEAARHRDLTVAQLVRRAVRAYTVRREDALIDGAVANDPAAATSHPKGEARS